MTAIRSLFKYAALRHPEHASVIARVLSIPPKRHQKRQISFLTADESLALIDAPDPARWEGRRDRAMLTLTIQAGLRVSELIALNVGDIQLETGAHVRCEGKGRKQRTVPLTTPAQAVLTAWLTERAGRPADPLFVTRTGRRLSRDAIEQRVTVHATTATSTCPSLANKQLHPHVLRHSCAMSLLQAGVDTTVIALAAVTELADHLHEIEQLTTRVDGIRERLNAFDDDAAALIEEVAPELASWPVHDAVAELERRVSDAIQARVSRATLEGEVDAARNELESANRSVEAAGREFATLLTLADVATIDELPEAERQSARVADLHDQLPHLERQITDTGHAPLHQLIERADDVDLDALDAQSAEGEDEIARLEEQLRELDVRIGELGGEQRKMERLQGAAGAAEHVEQRVAQLRELAERYVRLHLAAWALSEAIDAYRRAHKTPMLERADALFSHLTCGWFQGLEVTFDEADDPALVGVRRTGEKVPVKLMSTGTREQLYLSLRLASLERHVELRGPIPVILDDVVLHSDPQRKTAILRALAELGERTQVITFTHDPQVVALAQHAIDPDRLTVHELGGNEITGALQPAIAAGAVRAIRPARAA